MTTFQSALDLAAKNLVDTYTAIGGATPGASIHREGGLILCRCRLEHPVGNFALASEIDPNNAAKLAEIAAPCHGFNVYVLAGAERSTALALQSAGFHRTFRLTQMICANPSGTAEIELSPATERTDRERTAAFMVDQFFHRQRAQTRADIAKATVDCGLELFQVKEAGEPVGAVMVCASEGVLGIYNLCIRESLRGKGYGSRASRTLLARAADSGSIAVLQCEKELVPWYQILGFQRQGGVDVYTLSTEVSP